MYAMIGGMKIRAAVAWSLKELKIVQARDEAATSVQTLLAGPLFFLLGVLPQAGEDSGYAGHAVDCCYSYNIPIVDKRVPRCRSEQATFNSRYARTECISKFERAS